MALRRPKGQLPLRRVDDPPRAPHRSPTGGHHPRLFPAAERMGAYRVETLGELIRETVPRTDELRPRAGASPSAAGV